MRKTITLISLLLLCTSCATDETFAKSQRAIEDLGYTNVSYEGYAWGACDSRSDTFSLKYSAIAPTGRPVELAACSGYWKGVTVRTLN